MKNTLQTRLGIFFAVGLVAAAIILEMIGGLDLIRGGLQVKGRFLSVLELKAGDPVKMAGKQIGRVDTIDFADNRVVVLMMVTDRTAVIRTDTKATIKFSGLMGQNYVSLDFGTPNGARITTPNQEILTVEQSDISALMTKLDAVAGDLKKITANFTDLNVDELVTPFADFLKESRPRIAGILTNVQSISEKINTGQGSVGKLINEDTLYASALSTVTNLNLTAEDIRAVVSQARTVVTDVTAGKGTVGKLITDEKLYQELTDAATNLKEVLQKVNRGQGSVGRLVNDDTLVNNAKLTLQKLDKATESLEDQGPLTVIGMLINPLF